MTGQAVARRPRKSDLIYLDLAQSPRTSHYLRAKYGLTKGHLHDALRTIERNYEVRVFDRNPPGSHLGAVYALDHEGRCILCGSDLNSWTHDGPVCWPCELSAVRREHELSQVAS